MAHAFFWSFAISLLDGLGAHTDRRRGTSCTSLCLAIRDEGNARERYERMYDTIKMSHVTCGGNAERVDRGGRREIGKSCDC